MPTSGRTQSPAEAVAQAPAGPKSARKRALSSRQKARLAASLLGAKKAQRPVILDLRKLTLITDYFVICHGISEVHVRALAKDLAEQLKAHGVKPSSAEGVADGRWVLFDLGDVIVHIFAALERGFYDLERLWGDAPRVELE